MKKPQLYIYRKNKLNFYLRKIFSFNRSKNSDESLLRNKLRNLLIFYLLLMITSLKIIFLYLNTEALIIEQSLKFPEQGTNTPYQNSTQNFYIITEQMLKGNYSLEDNNKFHRILNNENNITKENYSFNEGKNKDNLVGILSIFFLIKFIITLAFVVFYY